MPKSTPTTMPTAIYVAWGTALAATLASVYFVEISGNPSATICWINRMLMFSLVLVIGTGIINRDHNVTRYAWPLVIVGLPLAILQQLVHWDIISITTATCTPNSIFCGSKYFNLFGFISQATLCLTAFVVMAVALWLAGKKLATR